MTIDRLEAAYKLQADIRRLTYYLEVVNGIKVDREHNFPDSWLIEEILKTVDKSLLQEILNLLKKDLTTKKADLDKKFAEL